MVQIIENLRKYKFLPAVISLLVASISIGLLAACVQREGSATSSAVAPDVEDSASAPAEAVAPRAAPDSITEDYTLIGQTRRPQFLNSFADW